MKLVRLGLIVFLNIFVLTIPDAYSESLLDTYYKFDRWASNFNPIGSAFRPLNEIPGLKVSGLLYQWTYINTHKDKQVEYVKKDWRFHEIQWRAQLEIRYQFAPRIELVNRLDLRFDGVYSWQESSLYANHINKDSMSSHTGEEIFRECHLDMELGSWYIKLGKQQVVWGKLEGRWTDFINNLNLKDGLQVRSLHYNELRIPIWMSNVIYTFGESSLQFIWIPDYDPAKDPYPGSPWWSPLSPDPRKSPLYRGPASEPSNIFKNHEWALGLNSKVGRVSWSLNYMYGFAPIATNFIKLDDFGKPFYDPHYTRSHFIGSSIDFGSTITGLPIIQKVPFTYRAELVYKTNQYFIDANKWDPQNEILKKGRGVSDTDLVSGAMQLRLYFPKRIMCYYQPMMSYYTGWNKSFKVNRWSLEHLFHVYKKWESLEDRLETMFFIRFHTGGPLNEWGGMRNIYMIKWNLSDYINIRFLYYDYRGGKNDPYGQFDLWDNFGWEISYYF